MRWIVFTLVGLIFSSCNRIQTDYDVIIVGGGLAGLSAAKELNSKKVLVLEKDSILGGRVQTRNFQGKYFYDIGADYIIDSSIIKLLGLKNSIIVQNEPIAYYIRNKIYSGSNVYECLSKIQDLNISLLDSLYNNINKTQYLYNDSLLYNLLNINFESVFPSSLKENILLHRFLFTRYNSSHFIEGNKVVVNYFIKNIKSKVELNSNVIEVDEENNKVVVHYINSNKKYKVSAKKCIVTVSPNVALEIIKKTNQTTKKFLKNVRFASYQVFTFGIRKELINNDYSYVLPINSGFSNIVKHKTVDKNFNIFQFYIPNESNINFKDNDDAKFKAQSLLKDIWQINNNEIIFYDFKYWSHAGAIVDSVYIKYFNNDVLKASKSVCLAGDYLFYSKEIPPYGMIPAIESGRKAAQFIKNK